MIYYKHYIGDYQRHTGHLSLAQDGAYRRMMDHYYSTEEPLPADSATLYRICGAMEKQERAAVDFVVRTFFIESNGRLHHQRIDEEIAIAQEKIRNLKANASAGGKQSGSVRSSKKEAFASPNAEANAEANGQADTNKVNSHNHTKPIGLEKHSLALPAWLAADDWRRFADYRRKASGKKFTPEAEKLNLDRLSKLYDAGNDPIAVLDQTIANGWSGLFEIKKPQARASPSAYQTPGEKRKSFVDQLTGNAHEQRHTIIDINPPNP